MNRIRGILPLMYFFSVVFSICLVGEARSQTDTSFWNSSLAEIADTSSRDGWIVLKESVFIPPLSLFTDFKDAFRLGTNDSMLLIRQAGDDLGFVHFRFGQLYRGIEVENAEFIVHSRDGASKTANGSIVNGLNLNTTPSVLPEIAVQAAINSIPASQFAWEVVQYEFSDSTDQIVDSLVVPYPSGELLITRIDESLPLSAANSLLSFRIRILATQPISEDFVYVDAHTGQVVKKVSLMWDSHCNCCDGSAYIMYVNGFQTITTKHRGFPIFNYLLRDNCRGDYIQTFLDNSSLTDGDNTWTAVNERPAVSLHWAGEKTYDYFLYKHGRDSFDNNGKRLKLVASSSAQNNASWIPSLEEARFYAGDGITASNFVSLDVVGHEITHGVTEHSAGLVYSYQSGALNESFSDIFGAMVEFAYFPGGGDWDMGEDPMFSGALRSMSNPNQYSQPDTYLGTHWATGPGDHGGVHTNSGVQNFWFYLLSDGGSGTNDLGNPYDVDLIGKEKAARITYRNLTFYLSSGSVYSDARNGSIQAARDLYGASSNEVAQVIAAWCAVGVGPGSPAGPDPWFKDFDSDNGIEPNPNLNKLPMWLSNDMWLNTSPTDVSGKHENAEFGPPNYVHVRLRNRGGCVPASGVVKIYWAKAATAGDWPKYWGGLGLGPYLPPLVPAGCNPAIWGAEITPPQAFGPLAPGQETVVHFPWLPPNPADFACFKEPWHFCLLARIETTYGPAPYGMTFPEGTAFWTNVSNNNNIIWKNISVVDLVKKKSSSSTYIVRNTSSSAAIVNLQFETEQFLNYGQAFISITPEMYQDWQNGGGTSNGLTFISGDTLLQVTTLPATFNGIQMGGEEIHLIDVRLQLSEDQFFGEDTTLHFTLTQFTEGSTTPDGGVTMAINVGPYPRIKIEKTHNTLQGQFEFVSIMLEDAVLPMGGFDFLLSYDASALSFTSAEIGETLGPSGCSWEYFTYRYGAQGNCGGPCPTGMIRVVAIAEANNGANHPNCFNVADGAELVNLKFLVTNNRAFECQYVPIRFSWFDCGDNGIASATGDTLYISDQVFEFEWSGDPGDSLGDLTEIDCGQPFHFGGACYGCDTSDKYKPIRRIVFWNGGVDIVCADSIDARGDLNLNSIPNEIADAVLYSNYFLYGAGALDPISFEAQIAASDVNNDGAIMTVGDLVYLLRIITGDALPFAKMSPLAAIVKVHCVGGRLSTDTPTEIGALFATFTAAGEVQITNHTDMTIESSKVNGELRILIYSGLENLERNLGPGVNDLFSVSGDVQLKSVEVADRWGNMLSAHVGNDMIPTSYSLAQNAPNPFNPVTRINLSLPTLSDWRIDIYNVTGQLVKSFSGRGAGNIVVDWDASDFASGVYLYKAKAGTFTATKRMVLLK